MYELILVSLIKLVQNIIAAAWCKQDSAARDSVCFIRVVFHSS